MEPKYKDGEFVCAKVKPDLKLFVRRYVDNIYFCRVAVDPTGKELAYFERELMGVAAAQEA